MTKMIGGATATYWEKIQTEEYYKELLEKKKEEQEAIQDRSEDAVIQTGASSYTQKQWNSMLKNFDEVKASGYERWNKDVARLIHLMYIILMQRVACIMYKVGDHFFVTQSVFMGMETDSWAFRP